MCRFFTFMEFPHLYIFNSLEPSYVSFSINWLPEPVDINDVNVAKYLEA